MTDATKAPAPWDNPGTLPTDAAQQEAAKAAALAAASTPTPSTESIAPGTADSSAAPGTAVVNAGATPEVASEVTVTVTVPKPFNLRLGHGDENNFQYKAGVQEMPLAHAEHWWAAANGVQVYKK